MTEQRHHPQPIQRGALGVDREHARTEDAGVEDLTTERAELDQAWAEFSRVRASVAEVMSDEELRAFGINVEALDERP